MKHIQFLILAFGVIISIFSCKKYIEIDPPRTELVKSTVFESDATANAAMVDIYYEMKFEGFASGSTSSISFWGSYSSDEQLDYTAISNFRQFNANDLVPSNPYTLALWSEMYKTIYKANAVIEGLASSQKVSINLKKQLEGEAKFMRAFCHFYLVNLFGDVPIITSTDYRTNAALPRAPKTEVYTKIIADLKDAQNLLPDNYSHANSERVRVAKGAATALLARTYLYTEDWLNAETQSTAVIASNTLYSLKSNLNEIFLKNSTEAILQLWSEFSPRDRATFRVLSTPNYGALTLAFANSFEPNDLRKTTWVNLNASGYYNARKYNAAVVTPPLMYSTVLRLAEQYLIRAEARAKQNKIMGANSAESDVNIIRSRAGLGPTTANTQATILIAVENERKWELFTEWGHRWLDLKRTGRAAAVLSPIKTGWQPTDVLYPIPQYQILNSTLTQNPGY